MLRCRMCKIQAARAEEILVPMITWNLDGQRLNADAGDVQQSLQAIRDYSVFQVPCNDSVVDSHCPKLVLCMYVCT